MPAWQLSAKCICINFFKITKFSEIWNHQFRIHISNQLIISHWATTNSF